MSEIIMKEQIIDAIKNKKLTLLKEIFETVPNIDIAEAMEDIEDVTQIIWVFRVISSEYTAYVFSELSPETQEKIINAFSDKDLIKLLENSFADDVADAIEEMPANVASRVLKVAPADLRKDVNQLLNYKENTAGSVMTTEFILMLDHVTVKDAIEQIRQKGKDAETVYTIFVRDAKRNLVGTVGLDDLIFADEKQRLEDIMDRDFVTCSVNDDQEEVANLFKRYDLTAMAVVNNEQKIIGIITIDDVVDVMEEEANEDIAALSHVTPLEESYLDTPARKMAIKCIPWIIILLILGTFTTMALDRIEKAAVFTTIPVLIAFVPALMDTGGNSGGQTIALMIRGLATKEFTPRDIFKVIRKELLTALIVATSISVFAFVWFTIEQYTGIVTNENLITESGSFATIWNGGCWTAEFTKSALVTSLIVATTLFVAAILSKIVAVLLPLTVAALKKDPAIIAQPLLTTIVDVVSLITYLGIATLFVHLFNIV